MSRVPALPLAQPPERLCLLRLSAIGDVINAVPVVHTLRRHWPDTALTWVVGTNEAPLVADLPGVEFVTFDKSAGWRGFRDLHRKLTGQRFDVLLQLQYALRANVAGACVRAPLRLGYAKPRTFEGHGLFVNRRIGPAAGPHMVDLYFAFLEALGLTERVMDWSVPIPESERAAVAALLPGAGPYLVVSPSATSEHKEWMPERYAAVADAAAERHGYTIVLSGGPGGRDRALADAVSGAMRTPAIDLVGRTSLKGMLALLERAEVLLTPDSGPAHLAAATDTDVIALLATSDGRRTGPYNSLQWSVDRFDAAARQFDGRPADELPWGRRFQRAGAMELITVDDVLERLGALHAARRGAPPR